MNIPVYNLVVLGVTFACVAAITYGLASYCQNRRIMRDRYQNTEAAVSLLTTEQPSLKHRFFEWLGQMGKLISKDKTEQLPQLKTILYQAGYRHPNAPAIYFGLRMLCAVTLPLPFLFVNIWQGKSASFCLMFAFMMVATGYFIPSYLLQVILRHRQDRIDKALPDVLDLMIVAIEAGLALQATFIRVAEEVKGISKDLHQELQITNAEMRSGITREAALKNLVERNGVHSIKSLVGLMLQSEKMGTSIAEALRTHGDFMRVERSQKAEEIAAKLPVKILFPLMICIMPVLFIIILGPGTIQICRNLLR